VEITATGLSLTHMYTGDDGESHLETVTYEMKPAPHGWVSDPVPVTGVTLRLWNGPPATRDHNSSRKQLVIHLAGEVELETSDGAKGHLGVGDILVSENVAPGKGHLSRELVQPRLHLLVPFVDGFLEPVSVEPIPPSTAEPRDGFARR